MNYVSNIPDCYSNLFEFEIAEVKIRERESVSNSD